MKIRIANPIYDSVFKYLVEDRRIAKTLISALLKKEVVDVRMNPHEYTNGVRDRISMFRIDFSADVREADGSVHLVLIELQKTWLETETLRFRQYLGAQYANPENVMKDDRHGYGIPMIAVYLLGHKLGDIEEPIVYASHKVYDYDGNELTQGVPDAFVESLVHDSIIVQIPRLHGQVNNRLEKVLSVFDQTQQDDLNRQMLCLDAETYEGDKDMMYILHRLSMAAADSQLRQDMNVEDEFFSAIENRDTEIMNRDKRIMEQDNTISEQLSTISEQSNKISEQSNKISEQSNKISEQSQMLRMTIKGLMDKGMSLEEISALMGRTVDELKALLE